MNSRGSDDYESMTYTQTLQLCRKETPDLIYISVGCAAHDDPHSQGLQQQFPPFVRDWPGKKVCILIDPMLESPPRITEEIHAIREPSGFWRISDTVFVEIRQNFHYQEDPCTPCEDIRFMEDICIHTLSSNAKLIVQDYTGRNIHGYYPINVHPDILSSVLYDVTYNDGGCSIDLDAIRILRDKDGGFIQPAYSPFCAIYGKIPGPIFQNELARRMQNLQILHTHACIVRGLLEPRAWLTEERVASLASQYSRVYRVDSSDILSILISAAKDICATASCSLSAKDIDTIVMSPSHQYITLFQNLRVILDSQ